MVTKSGANDFHGTAFEFFRNTVLNANDYFLKYADRPRPALNQNQFGGAIGGPIKKDKLFFFFSEQETRQKNGLTGSGYQSGVVLPPVPTGDRSNTAAFQAALGAAVCPGKNPGVSRDNTYSGGGVGLQVACDGSNINPIAIKILQLKNPDGSYYVPSSAIPGQYQTNVAYSIPATYSEHQVIGNFDYLINAKNTLSTRYFWGSDPTVNPLSCGAGGFCVPDTATSTNYVNHDIVVKLTSILSNNLVNKARIGIQRNITNDHDLVPFTNSQVGIANVTQGVDIFDQVIVAGQFELGGGRSTRAAGQCDPVGGGRSAFLESREAHRSDWRRDRTRSLELVLSEYFPGNSKLSNVPRFPVVVTRLHSRE